MSPRKSLATALLALALIAPVAAAQTYNQHAFLWTAGGGIQDLGVPPGWTDSIASAISQSGLVVGILSNSDNGSATAAAWTAEGGWRVLGKGLSTQYSDAIALNDSREIVGVTYTTGTTSHAFLWTATGGTQDLGTLGGASSVAFGIDDSGEVVGESLTAAGFTHAFLWTQSGGMQDLGTLMGPDSVSEAYAINNNGTIVGGAVGNDGRFVGVFWAKGQIHAINGLATNPASLAYGINKLDQIVGADSVPKSGNTNAFIWSRAAGLENLGFLAGTSSGVASGINSSAEVVGYDITSDGVQEAFAWTSSEGIQALGTLGGRAVRQPASMKPGRSSGIPT